MQELLANFVDLRFGMFLHYSLGTYSDEEWATPGQPPTLFAPPSVDCAQWAAAAKAAKMQYGVLTTKHHDGFSLWPTAFGTQNVAYSGYKQDVVRAYVDAFRAEGLKVGFYFSIWDRTAGIESYGGHVSDTTLSIEPPDIDVILGQLTELLTNYGPIDLLMTDGYTWQMGQQAVNYARLRTLVKDLQPNCLLTDICAVTEPWLGDAIFWEEPLGVRAPAGNTYAGVQGQTISNGWFWHPSTPTEGLMSQADILQHLADTEPRYTSFLLNCPPNRNGRLDTNVVERLAAVGQAWSGPNAARPPLPRQQAKVEWPIVPVAAHATSYNNEWGLYEVPYKAIDMRGDLNFETCWSTWTPSGTGSLPATLLIDLGGRWNNVSTLQYLPKQWGRSGTDGDVTKARVWTSADGLTYEQVAMVDWAPDKTPKLVEWTAREAAYVKFEILEASGGYSNVNGIKIGGRASRPVRSASSLEDTVVTLGNVGSGLSLAKSGTGVAQQSTAERWKLRLAEDCYWYVEHEATGQVLALKGGIRTQGAEVELVPAARKFAQHWALSRLDDGTYVITNRFNMLNLGVTSNSSGVTLRDPALASAQLRWELTPATAPVIEGVTAVVATRIVAGKVTLVVQVNNNSPRPITISTETAFGSGTTTVAAGKRSSQAFATRKSTIPAGTVTVHVSADVNGSPATGDLTVSYPAAGS
ncbi:alpha-L-fucosidase [Microbacterium sp. F51-2R]|uniref:alpha-L-fucosidase n=1 Tax=Microbacterium sp. F51-2R TaxID=3445777 RepID=UPI003FA050F5